MRLNVCAASILLFFFQNVSFASVMYTGAPTYPIKEQSMTVFLKQRITALENSRRWQAHIEQEEKAMQQAAFTPFRVAGISPTKTPRTFYYNPTVLVPTEITTTIGNTIVPASSAYNPLSKIKLNETLVFYDESVPAETAWAKQEANHLKGRVIWILVGGSLTNASKQLKTRVYFDQESRLTRKLNITHTPAIVTQSGLRLKIQEVRP